jgi:hypothetical protein
MNYGSSENQRIEGQIRHLSQDHPQKGTRHSPMIPSYKSGEKRPQIDESSNEQKNPRKSSENNRRTEMGGTTRTLEESRQTFYTHYERFIQGLSCLLNIHLSLKISP